MLWVPAMLAKFVELCAAVPESRTRQIHIVYITFGEVLWHNAHYERCTSDAEACFFSSSGVSLSIHKSVKTGNANNQTST